MLDQATVAALTAEPLLQAKLEHTLESFATLQVSPSLTRANLSSASSSCSFEEVSVGEGSPSSQTAGGGCCVVQ